MSKFQNVKPFIYLGIIASVIVLLPFSFYLLGLDEIKQRHLQFTTNQTYIHSLSCKALEGNKRSIESVQMFNVKQLEDDITELQKEKGCN